MGNNLLVIGWVWPEPASSAAGRRMMQLLETFLLAGYDITFASAAGKSPYQTDLRPLGIREISIVLNSDSFNDTLRELNPDVVLFDRYLTEEQFGWRVTQTCPDALTLLDTEDLHFLRFARQQAVKKKKPFSPYNTITQREIASILRCDLSLIISREEMQLLQKTFKIDPGILWYIPFMEDPLPFSLNSTLPKFETRKNFVFIGNFLHDPNVDAVEMLRKLIWPQIHSALPDTEIHVYGAYVGQSVQQLHRPSEGFIIKGRAGDARKTLSRYRVLLAPLRFGAGLKGKFIDAIHSGTPSVTTEIGAEALTEKATWPGFLSAYDKTFVQDAVRLYSDSELWYKAQQLGIDLNNRYFTKAQHQSEFLEKIHFLRDNIKAHRETHFIGQIMRMDTLNSKKYMSLWIQEKHK